MARPLFRWEHLPERVLRRLAEAAGLPRRDAATALGERFGVPPGEEFVQQAWPMLLDAWLKADLASAAVIALRLRGQGLGDGANAGSAAAVMSYLRSCENVPALRAVVLAAFLAAGASPTSAAAVAPRRRRSRTKGGRDFRTRVEGLARELLGVTELIVAPDGAIRLTLDGRLSFLRTFDDREQVQIFRPLVLGVARTPALFETLNDLNAGTAFARIFATHEGDVILALDLSYPDLRVEDLRSALGAHADLADALTRDLQGRFGGRRSPDPDDVFV